MRVLAIVCNFKWSHIDYMTTLGARIDLKVAWCGEVHKGSVRRAIKVGVRATPIGRLEDEGADRMRRRLWDLLKDWDPSVVHLLYYHHEGLTVLVREIAPPHVPVIFECRDPVTTLRGSKPGSESWETEKQALVASDAQILVSNTLRQYYQRAHGVDLMDTSIIVPHAYSARWIGPPSRKLSDQDGRVHMALVGSLHPSPDDGRYYVNIIRQLVGLGVVVHSHFHQLGFPHDDYHTLAEELDDYHYHPKVSFNDKTKLSEIISSYDLMGVFHQLDAKGINERATLAVCMPTKAVCGWLYGGIPVVCFRHYGGLVERIEDMEIGFVIDQLEEVEQVIVDRTEIKRQTKNCLGHRHRFTHEFNVERIVEFYRRLLKDKLPSTVYEDTTSSKAKEWEGYYAHYLRESNLHGRFHLTLLDGYWGKSKEVAESVFPYLFPASVVLEIACGPGRFAQHIAPRCGLLYCADILEDALSLAKENLQKLDNVRYQILNGYDLSPFPDATFDTVYSFKSFSNFDFELVVNYFLEMARVLRPDGVLVIEFRQCRSETDIELLLRKMESSGGIRNYENLLDRWRYGSSELLRPLCDYCGFEILDSDVARFTARKCPNVERRGNGLAAPI